MVEGIVLWENACVLSAEGGCRDHEIDRVEIDRHFSSAAGVGIAQAHSCRTRISWDFSDEDSLGVGSVVYL